jgi:ferredoxin
MASVTDRYPDNVPGAFFTDSQCIDCDLCRQTAPDFFDRNAKKGYSFVYRQPTTPEEIALCVQAVEECPVDAIGKNGAPAPVPSPA